MCVSLRLSVEKAVWIVRYLFPFSFTYILVWHSYTCYIHFYLLSVCYPVWKRNQKQFFTRSFVPYIVRHQSAPWQYTRRQILSSNVRACGLILSVTMRAWNHKVNSVCCGTISLSPSPTYRTYCSSGRSPYGLGNFSDIRVGRARLTTNVGDIWWFPSV